MTPEEYTRKVTEFASKEKNHIYVTFRTASHAKIVNDAMCHYAEDCIYIMSGTLEEELYRDALNGVPPGVDVFILITRHGPHWDVPGDVEIRFIDEPDEDDRLIRDETDFKHEITSSENISGNLDDFVVKGAAGFRMDLQMVRHMVSRFEDLWRRAKPIIM